MEKRNTVLDIAKGICIILMVIGHSGCPDYLHRFIYMFHMPCFFFISGYLLNDKYLTDLRTGLIKRLKGSYWPFVKWSLIFLLFHNLFAYLHFYADNYSLREFGIKVIRILTMTGSEQLLGGFWFLISLFWTGCGVLLFLYLFDKYNRLNNSILHGGVIMALSIAYIEQFIPIKIPSQFGEQTFLAIAFYLSGYMFKQIKNSRKRPMLKGLILLLIPTIASLFMEMDMNFNKGLQIWMFYLIAMSGTLGVLFLCQGLSKYIFSEQLVYIGNKTLYILTFHFLTFKLVSYIYIKISRMPIENLTSFPILESTNSWMWIIYSVVGISIPLLLVNLKTKIQSLWD